MSNNVFLAAVSKRIAASVLSFCNSHRTFHADELRDVVESEVGPVAPNSPYRIMYELRRQGKLNYRVLSRTESLYEIIPVEKKAA